MFTAICRKNCTWHGKYWEEGEFYKGKAEPPHHFEITERPNPKGEPKRVDGEDKK